MDGIFEVTTEISSSLIDKIISNKNEKYKDFKNLKIQTNRKIYKFKLSVINNKDIVGLDDCFISENISFITVRCMSEQSVVFSLDYNIFNDLKRKLPDIGNLWTKSYMLF